MDLRPSLLIMLAASCAVPMWAQLPFYTDDPSVTEPGKFHFEFFNEFDFLQDSQFPNLRQNTVNYKLNYGLPHSLELDVDSPYLAIFRAFGNAPVGVGDTNLGMKWSFHKESEAASLPAMSTSMYIEFPTGDARQGLGSGLTDYWLNFIAQHSFSKKTSRITANLGIVFAGNTSTGVLGVQTNRGRVYTGGLSLLHDFSEKLTLGAELYGGVSRTRELGRSQLQAMIGGQYTIRDGLAVTFGLLGGKYFATPRIGMQTGFAVDLPAVWQSVQK